jgi:hypothetical protein
MDELGIWERDTRRMAEDMFIDYIRNVYPTVTIELKDNMYEIIGSVETLEEIQEIIKQVMYDNESGRGALEDRD